ncbi:polysaccharide deacetylase family protein [Paraburkholderia bonniea]|uniref:polysaccharide deacetylase family protein n=1 Tax=Paraburkholderia bonniea TaxID=2152891 RepID=UPI0012914EB2
MPTHSLIIGDGSAPLVTPQPFDLLYALEVRATFCALAGRVLRYPSLAREIAKQGRALENHTLTHTQTFSLMNMGAMTCEVERAQHALMQLFGALSVFLIEPVGLRNTLLNLVLNFLDLQLLAWARRGFCFDTRKRDPQSFCNRSSVIARR